MPPGTKRSAMPAIEWYYHRNNCETCEKSRAFLERNGLVPERLQDARKDRIGRSEALKLAKGMRRIVATRGRGIVEIDMTGAAPSEAELAKAIVGPTGNLRAPAIRVGDQLLVGFNEDAYGKVLAK